MQNSIETITKNYVVDYLSLAFRDILVTEDGGFTQRYVYAPDGTRISAEYDYADGTKRGTQNAKGEYGENLRSDIAVNELGKVWFRTSMLGSTLFAVDKNGETVSHTIYDPWGAPLTETYTDTNFSGLDNVNNFTGYTWDEVLGLYYAQNRFYDADTHRFTQEDRVKDGANWYVYCRNNPGIWVDFDGLTTTNPADAISWNNINNKVTVDGVTYYSAAEIFSQLQGEVSFNGVSSILTYSRDGVTVTLKYSIGNVSKDNKGNAKNKTTFKGDLYAYQGTRILDGTARARSITLMYYNDRAYVTKETIMSYFKAVFCENNLRTTGTMPNTVSDKLVEFIKVSESFSATPYYATDSERQQGLQTIGYGHLIKAGESFTSITEAEALQLLKRDIESHKPTYFFDEMVAMGLSLNQGQYDALVSLCFNAGSEQLREYKSPKFREYLFSGKYTASETEAHFLTYTSGLTALEKRRKAEAKMFSYGTYDLNYL